jgi:hypothetical protein
MRQPTMDILPRYILFQTRESRQLRMSQGYKRIGFGTPGRVILEY